MDDQVVSRPARIMDHWKLLWAMDLEPRSTVPELGTRHVIESLGVLNLPRERLDRIRAVMLGAIEGFYSRYGPGERAPMVQVQVLAAKQPRRKAWAAPLSSGAVLFEAGKQGPCPPSSWGFFVIEKSAAIGRRDRGSAPYLIELFLYQEG